MNTSNLNIKFAFILFLLKFSWGAGSNANLEDQVDYYEDLINTGREETNNYQQSTDNEQYRPHSNYKEIIEYGYWDFIVVGAGCGGSVVANRLSEVQDWKILLIEAGGNESDFSVIPANHLYLHLSKFNWGYYSVPQNHSCFAFHENRCPVVRGKALGGSSALNYESYVRGHKDDFDRWAAQGNPGWTYREVLPYFIKSENSEVISDPGYHGRDGYWNVKYVTPLSEHALDFIAGSRDVRNFSGADYNGRNQLGAYRVQVNNIRQYRDSTNIAFLQPIIKRKNLKIITNAYVTKVITSRSSKKAIGILFSKDGKPYLARAGKEVILSAGAINTPQILMLSGIGPSDHLKEMNIPVVSDLPVGKTLYDHPLFYSAYIGTNLTIPTPTLRQQILDFLDGTGPLTMYSNIQVTAFYQTELEKSPSYPDLEMVLTLITGSLETFLVRFLRTRKEIYQAVVDAITNQNVMNAFQFVLKSESVGSVSLKSKDPYQHPNIDVNFLAEQYDVDILYQGIQTIKKIIQTEPLKKINATLILVDYPQCRSHELGSKDYWICAIRLLTGSSYHQSGTCRMGPDPKDSVVNNKGVVHGFTNLRVVDVSIFPSLVAGHTGAPTVMIGERISDFIKEKYGVHIQPIINTIS